ncbi:MAG: acyl-CoA dehydrogenase family protein, partial [Proteobacteria bacterium]|nr:acyl-CoA dehydrogenase family protein [Pseudomonadota bacterium]
MTAGLTDTQRAFQDTALRFARERIAPGYMTREQSGRIDRALIKDMGALGLIGADIPEAFGGMGEASVTVGLIMEAIGYADLNVAYVPLLASLNGQIVARHGSPALAAEWLPRIISGDAVSCLALTEPRGGSDAANLVLSARRDGEFYRLNGEKSSISMADQADVAVL